MDILFIADPLSGFKIYKDSTFVMMQAATQRGHRLFFAETGDLFTENEKVLISAQALTLQTEADIWYALEEKQVVALCDFDAVIMRKDPPFDLEYLYATHLFSQAEAQGAKIFNAGQVLRDMNEKLAILGFSKWIVPTLVTAARARLDTFIQAQGTVILKPLDSMGGDSIFKVTPSDPNLPVILETMLQKGRRTIMAQAFIPEIVDGDKRILVIDGEPVPFALARIPAQGATRGNLAAGGRGVAQPLSESDWQLAKEVGQVLKARGVFLAGLDVIGQHLTEVNVTSPTCFREIMTQTGTPVGEMWIQALENRCGF